MRLALDHPLVPMLTGIRAYGAWVRGEFDLAVQLAEETRQLERRLSVFPVASRNERSPTCCTSWASRRRATPRRCAKSSWQRSPATGRGCHACYLAAVGHSSNGDYEEAEALVARAERCGEIDDVTD